MRFVPGSLLWRTLGVVVVSLVLSQAAALWLLHEFVTQPRAALGVGQFVSHLKTLDAALQTMGPHQQQEFLGRIAEKEGIRVVPVRGNERLQPAPDAEPVRLFRERIREIFGPETDVYVRGVETPDPAKARRQLLLVRLPAGGREFWVGFPRTRIDRDPSSALVAWGVAGLVIAILATFLIVWRLNRPLAELARAAARLGRGGDPPPVAETGPSEIRAVARAFNKMKDDLQKAQRERSTFLAGVSHDLRTPLARLRLQAELLGGGVDAATREAIVHDLDDMNAIIDQFIDFARSEAAEPLERVDLSALARGAAERAMRSGAVVRCALGELPALMLRPLAMRRLADNLVANAARHAGGEIVVRTASESGAAVLSVLDRGPGIPVSMVERLKKPFTRRDEARSGTSGAGLGLAIAERIAALHGGRLDLVERAGGGLEARVTLPLAA